MMPARHYYHVYAAGAWSEPVRDHLTALGRAGLDDTVTTIGLVGPEEDRRRAREMITLRSSRWDLAEPARWLESDEGWEQLTLQRVHQDVHEVPGDFAVLYAHAKGSSRDTDDNAAWRRSMTRVLVRGWESCADLLSQGYDAVGCHWSEIAVPGQPARVSFAGNFWWARASYLRKLPVPENKTRWSAETWVSLGDPKVYDLLPGRPDYP